MKKIINRPLGELVFSLWVISGYIELNGEHMSHPPV
jgi:hypothetical protein